MRHYNLPHGYPAPLQLRYESSNRQNATAQRPAQYPPQPPLQYQASPADLYNTLGLRVARPKREQQQRPAQVMGQGYQLTMVKPPVRRPATGMYPPPSPLIPPGMTEGMRQSPLASATRPSTGTTTPDHDEVKRRIAYIQKIFPTRSTNVILQYLRQNNLDTRKTIEALADVITDECSELELSKKMLQQSLVVLSQSQVGDHNLQSSFLVSKVHLEHKLNAQKNETGLQPAFHVSQVLNEKVQPTGRRKALLIGINYYGSKKELNGCCQDVRRIKKLINNCYGFLDDPSCMTLLMDEPGHDPKLVPSKRNIQLAMKWLVDDSEPGDVLFFHFSGHGSQQKDLNGTEIDGFDETILPVDYKRAGHISDDDINDTLVKGLKNGVKLVCIMDCCHSGSAMDLPYYLDERCTSWKTEPYPKFSEGDVMLISSCQDNQTAADLMIPSWGSGGAVTLALVTALSQNPHNLSIHDLLRKVKVFLSERSFSQAPQISSTQPFDLHKTVFNMEDIVANQNTMVGYAGPPKRYGRR